MADSDLEIIHHKSVNDLKEEIIVRDEILIDSEDDNRTFCRTKTAKRYVFSSDSDDEVKQIKKRERPDSDVDFIIDENEDMDSEKMAGKKKRKKKKKVESNPDTKATKKSRQSRKRKSDSQEVSNEESKEKKLKVDESVTKTASEKPKKKRNKKLPKLETKIENGNQSQCDTASFEEPSSSSINSSMADSEKNKSSTTSPKAHTEQKKTTSKLEMNWMEAELLSELQNIPLNVAENIINLFDTDNTIPFIARYRKELTGRMEAEKLRHVKEAYESIKAVKQRAAFVIGAIAKLEKLTPDLERSIRCARSVSEIDHFYAPYKTGRAGTLADRARKLGLEEMAIAVLTGTREVHPSKMVRPGVEGLETIQDVISGLQHIISDTICKNDAFINFIRDMRKDLHLKLESVKSRNRKTTSKKNEDIKKDVENTAEKFENYYNFSVPVKNVRPHQVLALNRGESQKELSVKIPVPEFAFHRIRSFCYNRWLNNSIKYPLRKTLIEQSLKDAYSKRVEPLIVRQTRAELSQEAECASIEVFASNLKALLLAPPLRGKPILGIDPGFRNGCKLAAISETGEVLHTDVIYPHTTSSSSVEKDSDAKKLKDIIFKHGCTVIALGNATACRETEEYLSRLIANKWFHPMDVSYTIVNEQGASIYSCSPIAKKEFPDMDPNIISAVSLARRLQDPLSELVKVEPRHMGVGMYQHDISEKKLAATLDEVVSECVSFVGVDANTASECLLRRVAGMTAAKAQNLIEWRSSRGPFVNRNQLKLIKGIGPKTYEQCVGFIRIMPNTFKERPIQNLASRDEKENPLDQTCIHPESYGITERFLKICQLNLQNFGKPEFIRCVRSVAETRGIASLCEELECPDTQLQLIVDTLQRPPGHDLRTEFSKPLFRKGINDISSLRTGELMTGAVRNVTHFGAFVDIGVGCSGLIHNNHIKGAKLSVGQTVEVKVLSVSVARKRIGLELVRICS